MSPFWVQNANISLKKTIDRCRSTKLPLDTNFQLPRIRSLSNSFWTNKQTKGTNNNSAFNIRLVYR